VDLEALQRDRNISKAITEDKKRIKDELRLLLLGAGESGKSTIAKQLKILYHKGFNPEEKLDFIPIIHSNIHDSIQNVAKASKSMNIPFSRIESSELGELFMEPFSKLISPELSINIEEFWKDEAISQILERRSEFQLLDNTQYFITHLRRVTEKGYCPSDEDILRSRAATTGVIETHFNMQGRTFVLVDVGGQRSERKKWMHCFEDVSAVLFCVAISAFDQTLYEDNETNRILEALKLFHEICISKWFSSSSILLFLNKSDLFKQKLAEGKSISIVFPEFTGESNYKQSISYITEKFTNVADPVKHEKREIYHHVTTATDTSHVRDVFEAVKDYVIQQALKRSGLG